MIFVHPQKLAHRGDVNNGGHRFGPVNNECQLDKYRI